jgi:hypothetical protein
MTVSAPPQVKGTNLLLTVKALRANREAARKVLPPHLHRYLEGRILSGSWYPEVDLLDLLSGLEKMLGKEPRSAWEFFGEQAAEGHSAGPYETFFRRGPRAFFDTYEALWRLQHDSGRWEQEVLGERELELRLLDFPAGMPRYGHMMVGYFRRILRKCGAASAECELLACDATSGRWRLRWAD